MRSFESLNLSKHSFKPLRPSIDDPLTLELKHFPLHLKYAYLGDNNIKGISPVISMYKILLENWHGNSIEQQRRLNPIMKEVVKKEIIKWIDTGIIYHISDSLWVSPVQCVPKKGVLLWLAMITANSFQLILSQDGEFAWNTKSSTKQPGRTVFLCHSSIKC
ncbi:RNA-directed DNA polymerase-like protein [Gossypium australe]|uniref:RNA-directed DNA polymerase-like protein n=1 Tax=Gossypium australe TaxID=47621 RepID=A0A5B6WY83_9ROSI|nr:RNA-directed DNA polymerase-like protein [Gossypium australe]